MKTTSQTGMQRLTIALTTLFIAAAIMSQIYSGYQRRQMLRDAEEIFDAHVRSVVLLIREGARQAGVSTSLIYEMAEETLAITADMLVSNGESPDPDIIAAPFFSLDRKNPASTRVHIDRNLRLNPEPLLKWMKQRAPDTLVDDGVVGAAGLICLRFERDDAKGVVCNSSELLVAQRREAGIGPLLRGVVSGSVRYAAIQDETGILAAFPAEIRLSKFADDLEVRDTKGREVPRSRLLSVAAGPIHEGLAPFQLEDGSLVVLRVGVDAATLVRIVQNAQERWLTMTLLTVGLALLGIMAAFVLFRWQKRRLALEQETARAIEMRKHWELIGGLAASVAHEVRNPLNTIKMVNTRLDRELDPLMKSSEISEMLEIARQETDRVESVVRGFLELGKPHPVVLILTPMFETVTHMIAGMTMAAEDAGIHLKVTIPEDLFFVVDRVLLERIVRNLIGNALCAVSKGGEVTVSAEELSHGFELRITDTGQGMRSEQIEQALKPFHTTRATGIGLGLPIVVRSVELLEGLFHLDSEPGRGTTAVVFLPRRKAAA